MSDVHAHTIDASKSTTIILVHGMWHQPSHWDPLIPKLSAQYNILTPALPSTGASPPLSSFEPEIEAVRDAISTATSAGQKVVLVLHSYAGIPGSEAVQGYTVSDLRSQGHTDGRGVQHVLCIAAFMFGKGDTVLQLNSQHPVDHWVKRAENFSEATVHDPAWVFYADCNDFQLVHEAASKVQVASLIGAIWEQKYPVYQHVPTTYVHCTADRAVVPAKQEAMIKAVQNDSPLSFRVVTYEGCGHTPWMSRLQETSDLILAIAQS